VLVAMDATPLIGRMTGVGRYVSHLAAELAGRADVSLTLVPITLRGRRSVPAVHSARLRRRPAPARLVREAWMRTQFPPAELFAGRCDVFHGTNFVLPPRRRAAGVVTVHDLSYLRFPDAVTPDVLQYQRLVPNAIQQGAIVVTPSRSVAEEVTAEYGLSPGRVCATPLGVGSEWFEARAATADLRKRHQLPDGYVLFVGTREPRKNLATLLSAHARGRSASSDVPPLVLVGPPGWGEAVPSQPGVIVLDHVLDADLRSIVAEAMAVLMPSHYEGFGLPVLEALAAGVPVVASDLPVLREVGGNQALYVDPTDVDGWAQTLLRIEGGQVPGTAESRAQRARSFTWSACADATVEAYRKALAR